MTNPYAPPGESAADLWLERSYLVGSVLAGIAYGVHLAVFAECVAAIYKGTLSRNVSRIRATVLFSFTFVLFAMGTLCIACNTWTVQLMFIDNRNYPGGPDAYLDAVYDCACGGGGNAAYIIANFLADGALLWRLYVVWDSVTVVIVPFIVYLGSTVMSILSVYQSSRPNANLWTKTAVSFSLPYFTISISLNIILTLLLVGRFLHFSYIMRHGLLGQEHTTTYISVATMLVESAAPYAIAGLIFIISYARKSNVMNLVLPMLIQTMCISPELIILRVANGRAINSKTTQSGTLGTIEFCVPHTSQVHDSQMKSVISGQPSSTSICVTPSSSELHQDDV